MIISLHKVIMNQIIYLYFIFSLSSKRIWGNCMRQIHRVGIYAVEVRKNKRSEGNFSATILLHAFTLY